MSLSICISMWFYDCLCNGLLVTIPYFSLDYNIGYVFGSFEPGHAKDHLDDNFARHTWKVGAKNWELH